MAKANYVQKGENIDFTATSDIGYLDVVPLTTRIGIALEEIKAGQVGTVAVSEVYELPAVTNAAFVVGDALYWNGTAVTKTATDNTPAGWAIAPKVSSGATALVRIG